MTLCALKNQIYLVYDGINPVAIFQTKRIDQSYLFQKLTAAPKFAGKGIETFCIIEIERLAKSENCKEVICAVHDRDKHAESFYEHKGYTVYGETDTLKYRELKLRKEL